MGTVKEQEGFLEEWEVQEAVLGHKPRVLGGDIVQAPPRDICPSIYPDRKSVV